MAGDLLHRKSSGLTEAHVALIKMLAAKAVTDFLTETESADRDDPVEEKE